MTEPATEPQFDPRFDPRFQRGWSGRPTDATADDSTEPGRSGGDAPAEGAGPTPVLGSGAAPADGPAPEPAAARPADARPSDVPSADAPPDAAPPAAAPDAARPDTASDAAPPLAAPPAAAAHADADRIMRIAFGVAWSAVAVAFLVGVWAVWMIVGQDPFAAPRQASGELALRSFAYVAGPPLLGSAVVGIAILTVLDGIRRLRPAAVRAGDGGVG
ncbi:hypothetical protein GCM10017608_00550 [Agromyces luteolus]|uniref:Uncharacterized protein n=1 Tax=Agromyces luteolus TaxID=88373 RepID=A0A7C9HFN2_9MICO|nr:hypothetical protein [Agromyces luteolus]MUN05583.1 hypothetical protein [Agromyces luteolus]GLK26123.1 hypothetical protein GCM10017608_00550 [Agromyces luteolus]